MEYELMVTLTDGRYFRERARLPEIMQSVGDYNPEMVVLMQIENLQTGEVIAAWRFVPGYGLTSV